jgi:hypothetical protein
MHARALDRQESGSLPRVGSVVVALGMVLLLLAVADLIVVLGVMV